MARPILGTAPPAYSEPNRPLLKFQTRVLETCTRWRRHWSSGLSDPDRCPMTISACSTIAIP